MSLSAREQQVYDFVKSYIHEHGKAPYTTEVAEYLGVCRETAYIYINRVVKKGFLERIPYEKRGLALKEVM